jgi:hypothetical protein
MKIGYRTIAGSAEDDNRHFTKTDGELVFSKNSKEKSI